MSKNVHTTVNSKVNSETQLFDCSQQKLTEHHLARRGVLRWLISVYRRTCAAALRARVVLIRGSMSAAAAAAWCLTSNATQRLQQRRWVATDRW